MSGKVFPSYATENTSAPYIVFHKYNRQIIKTMDNSVNMSESNYGVILFCEKYSELQSLYKSVRDKLHEMQGQAFGNQIQGLFIKEVDEGFDGDVKLHRMDISIKTYFKE